MVRASLALVLLSLFTPARAVDAQELPPVVVVIEAAGTRFDVSRIRSEMQAQLGVPVISILEVGSRTPLGTLAVAVTERGRRAAINFTPSDGTRYAILVEVRADATPDSAGEWLVAPCVSAVRTSNQRRAAADAPVEVLDPWLASRVLPESAGGSPREVLDPWVGTPRRRVRVEVDDYFLGDEILDPWEDAVGEYRAEQAERLTRPRPTPAPGPRRPTPAPAR